jgi:hypothetical protein
MSGETTVSLISNNVTAGSAFSSTLGSQVTFNATASASLNSGPTLNLSKTIQQKGLESVEITGGSNDTLSITKVRKWLRALVASEMAWVASNLGVGIGMAGYLQAGNKGTGPLNDWKDSEDFTANMSTVGAQSEVLSR